ncbi:MAG: PAS domain-containing protein, partial [Candidatus Competibacterales bacterium]|nr:PAS domain-containing protein [Candidatus Competibacterales bacterium]
MRDFLRALRRSAPPSAAANDYRELFESASLGLFQATLDGRLLRVNPAFARIFGYPEPAALLAEMSDIGSRIFPATGFGARYRSRMARDGRIQGLEYEIRRCDGSTAVVTESSRVVHD